MTIRPLSAILTDISATLKMLGDQHIPPISFDDELGIGDRALQSGIESQAFRAMEMLIFSAHASGLTKEPALQQDTTYIEAVQVFRMSGKPFPADL